MSRLLKLTPVFLLAALVVEGCGQTYVATGTASVTGTVFGQALAAKDAVFVDGASEGQSFRSIEIMDVSGICPRLQQNQDAAGSTSLTISLVKYDADGGYQTPGVGTYPIASGTSAAAASAVFDHIDQSCASTLQTTEQYNGKYAASGSVTVSQADSTQLQGSFDLTMESGDHLTGSFTAPSCAPPQALPPYTCQ